MAGHDGFTVTPRRGELIVFDKLSRPLVNHVRAAGAHRDDQGRPRRADGVRQRDARADRGRHRAQGRHELDRRRPRPPAVARGGASCPSLLEQEVTAVYVGPARRHRARRLPARGRRRPAATRAPEASARPGSPARWRSPSTSATSSTRAGLALARAAGGLPELRMPNIGEACPRPYAAAGADRRGPRLRADRLLLRAGHAGRDPRRGREPDPARRPRRAAPAHPRAMGRCQGFFCGARRRGAAGERRRTWRSRRAAVSAGRDPREAADVAVVGGGPAGRRGELRRAGAGGVVVLEREAEPGGIPRHAQHQGFGLRDLHRRDVGAALRGPPTRSDADRRGRRAAHRDEVTGWAAGRGARADRPGGRELLDARGGGPGHRLPRAAALGPARAGLAARRA